MEGPTSVSAVIHAATLVVAGVLYVTKVATYLWCLHNVMWVWALGVCSYSLLGMSCIDGKRVIAYSTAWHVGVLSVLTSTGGVMVTYHLIAHALFKSGLFMVVGILLHSTSMQDSRSLPSIAVTGTTHTVLVVYLMQSIGWLYTPT